MSASIKLVTNFRGRDIGDRVNAAVRTCGPTGCVIVLPAGKFLYSDTIRLDRPGISLVGMGAVATQLFYTGSGTGLLIEEGGAPPFIQGRLENLSIDGSQDFNTGVAGITMINTIGFVFGDGLAIWNFSRAADSGMLWLNSPADSCGTCQSGFSERTSVEQVSIGNNTVELELESVPGSVNSFEFTRILDLHLQIMDGQTGLLVQGTGAPNSAVLANSVVNISANTTDLIAAATFIRVEDGGGIFNNKYTLMDEETYGSHEIPLDVHDQESTLVFGPNALIVENSGGRPVIRGTFVPGPMH